jgi:NADPH-dependent 2,4-dienoyl-CoA reductase/sulfur reductase-like enzyme
MRIVVVGAGPAGIAAAVTAAENGAKVFLVDENPAAGGQIWRHGGNSPPPASARPWLRRLRSQTIEFHSGTTVLDWRPGKALASREGGGIVAFPGDKIILAAGARELFLPFPGWTLPHVMGCGGAQAFLKMGWPVRGMRVVVAGSGPLLLAVAAAFAKRGAQVVGILEQADFAAMARFATALLRHPAKLRQGMGYGLRCLPARLRTGAWVRRVLGEGGVQAVVATDGSREWRWECDLLACGFGLVPNTELAASLGCRLDHGRVVVDAAQRSSLAEVYCAGEGTGIGGEDVALLEGEIAALSALGVPAEEKIRRRRHWDSFLTALETCFRPRPELLGLCESDTVVCRCEDVPFGALKGFPDPRAAKLHTRCGMGPCQGRICGPACAVLFGWGGNKTRPPLVPLEAAAFGEYLRGG